MPKEKTNKRSAKPRIEKRPILKRMLTKKTAFILSVIFIGGASYLYIVRSDYLKIGSIDVIDASGATELTRDDLLRLYKGRNIFEVDISLLATQIKQRFPAIKDAIVKRVMPNKLEINIIPRVPIARIGERDGVPIDDTGMILSSSIKTGNLPVIEGFSVWFRPKTGERLKGRQIENALSLLVAMQSAGTFSKYGISSINVSNYQNISFFLGSGIEIKIGGEDFTKRLRTLESTLRTPDLDKDNIKYIDLRFKDVVIGPK